MRSLPVTYAFFLAVLIFQVVWLVLMFNSFNFPAMPNAETRRQCECTTATTTTTTNDHTQLATSSVTTSFKQKYFLVVIVLSGVNQRKRRDSLRSTWMSKVRLARSVKFVFCIGTRGLSDSDSSSLHHESNQYLDMLLLPDLKESYYNLTRKLLHSLVWADNNIEFNYLMKCDDDTFVWLEPLVEELSKHGTSNSLYWGFFDGRATAKRKGKWVEQDWFLCDKYLPYALGGGYIMSADLVHRIAVNADGLQLYNAEDVSMGVWLSSFRAVRRHDVRFNTEFVSRGCNNQYLVSHKQSIQDMQQKHANLQQYSRQCSSEYQVRLSYEYDWSVDPSKCCQRTKGII